jgi:hypothetical protein
MFDAPIYICVQNMAFRIVIGIKWDTVSFVQEIRTFRKFAASRPTPNPACEEVGLATTSHKKLRLLSLRAKQNLLADIGIASPPAAARNVTVSSLQKGDLFTTETTEITETKDNFIFSQK